MGSVWGLGLGGGGGVATALLAGAVPARTQPDLMEWGEPDAAETTGDTTGFDQVDPPPGAGNTRISQRIRFVQL
jgi:hypothetical protein